MEAKMQNGSSKTGRGVVVNGTVSTLKRQPRSKTASGRQERGSCSSTASCPVFSGCQSDLDEEAQPHCPSSLSSPTLHKPGSTSNLKGSVSSLQGSLSSLKGSATSLKSFPTSSTLRSSSPSLRSSSEDDSWDTNSWSSGATCLLRSSIKQHSEEVFRVRAGSASRREGTSDSETGYQNSDSCQGSVMGSESQEGAEQVDAEHRDSSSSLETSAASTASSDLEQKIEEKLKFSQFLDEVTCRVLKPECLQAFGAPIRQKEPITSSLPCLNPTSVSSPWFGSSACDFRDSNVYKWAKCMPSCKILDASETLRRTQEDMEMLGRTYLETDIDRVRKEDEVSSTLSRDVEKRALQLSGESSRRCPVSKRSDGAPQPPYRTTSLPRPAVSGDMVSDGDANSSSWLQEQKEDLRRRLGCSTHKLQQLQSEFQSTRQYLEMELRRAQEKLDKFTEKLRRIQSSYAALQRINQDMEGKIHQMTQSHEEEKRSLNQEIGTLKNHLMEAKITIQKLREDNDLYRKDCNLAAQLLQCGKSPYRAHKLSELPADLQERVSSHMERQHRGRSAALRHSYSDAVPTAIIGQVLEKPEPGRSCPVTRLPSPQAPEFPDKVQRHTPYKSSDLYCSDTALYCPTDEQRRDRWLERRQSADQSGQIQGHTSTDGNMDDERFPLHEDPFRGFVLRSLPASSCYSSCSTVSDEKLHGSSLCTDWRDERKNLSSYGKERPGFPKSSSFQHVGSQNDRSRDRRILVPADPTDGWRQMSVEDVSRFSPFGFSEHHFKIKPGPLYGSYQDGDNVFHRCVPDPGFPASVGSSPALNPKRSLNALKAERGLMFCSKDSTSSFFITGNGKDKKNTSKQKDYANESPGSSAESLNQGLDVQKYKDLQNPGAQKMTPRHQKFGNAGLSRKDSLTKAQLYGTLLN